MACKHMIYLAYLDIDFTNGRLYYGRKYEEKTVVYETWYVRAVGGADPDNDRRTGLNQGGVSIGFCL